MECWRAGQVKHEEFLNDVKLLNDFINIQKEANPDFLIEVFLEPSSGKQGADLLEGAVNIVVSNSVPAADKAALSQRRYREFDVISLNTSLAMTGFCLPNEKAKSNTRLYSDISTSNLMGAWGFMNEAIEHLWWAVPTDWDRLDAKTKQIYIDNYTQSIEVGGDYE